jgi:serine O-acetyltransferase
MRFRRRGNGEMLTPRQFMRELAKQHPPFIGAALADAHCACNNRGEKLAHPSRARLVWEALRLAWVSDAYFALACYRAKARLQGLGVPVLPKLAHRLAMASAQVCIGDPVVIEAGIYLPHGQVVIDGLVRIGAGTAIRPWVTIGLAEGKFEGPQIGRSVRVGTGAKVFGPVTIGDHALIGANAVVLDDVPSRATAVGVPARITSS